MRTLIYDTISDITFAYSTPSVDGTILSIIKKGVSLSIDSIVNGWASYTDNNTIYYIKQSDLKLSSSSSGAITIKYIDEKTNEEIKLALVKNELPLGEYNFAYEEICGYTLNDDISKKVILDENNKNEVIFFKYKKNIADELLTIYYLDSESNESIYETKNYTSNTLSDMCNTTLKIPGYDLISTEITSSLITKITYKYRKNTGSIRILYMDENSEIKLSDSDEYIDLELGKYEYTAKNISGFSVIGNETQSVILSHDNNNNNNITIVFNYKEDYLPLDVNNQNEVPYISTYYIKPIIKLNEDVILDFYITDYYHKEYIEEDFSELFTVTIKIDGKPTIIKTNLTAGDHSINIGSFSEEKEQNFSIICTDKYGRNSHELFNYFLVRNEPEMKEYIMTEDDLIKYNIRNTDEYEEIRLVSVDLSNQTMTEALTAIANIATIPFQKYVCFIGDSNGKGVKNSAWNETIIRYGVDYDKDKVLEESTTTRKGLQKLIDDTKSLGFTKLTLLNGIYRIDHSDSIYIPSNFTLNMNNSTIKLNQFAGNKALMISLYNTYDSHVVNGTIEGDYFSHDYTNSSNNSEWVNGICIEGNSRYSSFENLNIKNITGYGTCNGIGKVRDAIFSYTYLDPIAIGDSFKLGDVDTTTGLDISSINRTTSKLLDITGYSELNYLTINRYLGYQGNPCSTWNIICHFYDKNKNYIKSIHGYQYRNVLVPTECKYLKVTLLCSDCPKDLYVTLFGIPTHCAFKNILHNNCRCVGMAQGAMKDMLIESCEFTNCGQSAAKCAYDAEDGWDQMQDSNFFKLNFHDNPNNDFLTCGGHNFKLQNFINGKVYFWEKSNSYCIKNCSNITNATLRHSTRIVSGYSRFYDNTINLGLSIIDESNTDNWIMAVKNSTITQRAESKNGSGLFINCNLSDNSNMPKSIYNGLGNGNFINCTITNINSNYNYGGSYTNCNFKNIRGNLLNNFVFKYCTITSLNCYCTGSDYNFNNCILNNFSLQYNYWYEGANLSISNCKINTNDYLLRLPNYSMKHPISLSNNSFISTGTNGLIYFFDDRTGGKAGELVKQSILTLSYNNISLDNSKYVFTGLSQDSVNNINIVSIKNIFTPNSLLLCNPTARNNPNITIIEN